MKEQTSLAAMVARCDVLAESALVESWQTLLPVLGETDSFRLTVALRRLEQATVDAEGMGDKRQPA